MLYFRKNKIKLSLIEDYIKLQLINKLKINPTQNTYLINNLIDLYEDLFIKLKMNDLSLLILKKELKTTNFSAHDTNKKLEIFNSYNNFLNNILLNLKTKLQVLKLKNYSLSSSLFDFETLPK